MNRLQAIANAIKAEGGNLAKLTVRQTSRPMGGWKWGNAYTWGIYHKSRRNALWVADFKIQAKAGTTSQPAKGWEGIDALAQREARRVAAKLAR